MSQFLNEIMEQPASTQATLDYYISPAGQRELGNLRNMIRSGKPNKLIFTGMGSSFFVSYAASLLFNKLGIASFAMNTS